MTLGRLTIEDYFRPWLGPVLSHSLWSHGKMGGMGGMHGTAAEEEEAAAAVGAEREPRKRKDAGFPSMNGEIRPCRYPRIPPLTPIRVFLSATTHKKSMTPVTLVMREVFVLPGPGAHIRGNEGGIQEWKLQECSSNMVLQLSDGVSFL